MASTSCASAPMATIARGARSRLNTRFRCAEQTRDRSAHASGCDSQFAIARRSRQRAVADFEVHPCRIVQRVGTAHQVQRPRDRFVPASVKRDPSVPELENRERSARGAASQPRRSQRSGRRSSGGPPGTIIVDAEHDSLPRRRTSSTRLPSTDSIVGTASSARTGVLSLHTLRTSPRTCATSASQ